MRKLKWIVAALCAVLVCGSVFWACGDNTKIEYTLSADGNSYILTKVEFYRGEEFVVPSEYKGKPVTGVGDGKDGVFDYCFDLKRVELPDTVTNIYDFAFRGCSVESINIPDKVVHIGKAAFNSQYLYRVTVPRSVVSIGEFAFSCECMTVYCEAPRKPDGWDDKWSYGIPVVWDCKNNDKDEEGYAYYILDGIQYKLKNRVAEIMCQPRGIKGEITVPARVTYKNVGYNVKSVGDNAFAYCSGLKAVDLPSGLQSIGEEAFESTGLTKVVIPNSVQSLGRDAFSRCENLTEVTLPSTIKSIGESAFFFCNKLTRMNYTGDLSGWCDISFGDEHANPTYYTGDLYINGSLVTSAVIPCDENNRTRSYLFANCKSLRTVTVPAETEYISGHTFYLCSGIEEIRIPAGVKSIGAFAFLGCDALEDVYYEGDLNGWLNMDVKSYDSHPMSCAKNLYIGGVLVESVVIPDGLTEIKDYRFMNCRSLTNVKLPDGLEKISGYAFFNCGFTNIELPSTVTEIGSSAFEGCHKLTEIAIPDGVTVLHQSLFEGCTSLSSVELPASVIDMYYYVFKDCSALKSITFKGTKAQWQAIDFPRDNGWCNGSAIKTISCSDGTITL